MREILFRGKRIDNGEWVEGNYIHRTKFYGDIDDKHFILVGGEFDCDFYDAFMVDPSTVGQYTGLNDRNGIKIFEGDVCLIEIPRVDGKMNRHICKCEYEDGCFWFCSEDDYWCRGNEYGYHDTAQKNIEVIGNIYGEEKK